jgi:hypothetical protein
VSSVVHVSPPDTGNARVSASDQGSIATLNATGSGSTQWQRFITAGVIPLKESLFLFVLERTLLRWMLAHLMGRNQRE